MMQEQDMSSELEEDLEEAQKTEGSGSETD